MRRYCLAALCGLAVMLFCAGFVWGAETDDAESGKYVFSGGEIRGLQASYILGIEPDEDGYRYVDLDIPTEIGGTPVKAIADQAFYAGRYTDYADLRVRAVSLERASSLEKIGSMAFYNMGGNLYGELKEWTLTLPESLRSVGGSAFCYQRSLRGDLLLPDSLESVGANAFKECGFDGVLRLPENENFTKVESEVFRACGFTGALLIPANVTELTGSTAFLGNQFDTLMLHDGVTAIGSSVFKDCAELTWVGMDGGVPAERSVTLPKDLKTLGDKAFNGCAGLTGSVTVPEGVTVFGNSVFGYTGIQTIYAAHSDAVTYDSYAIRDMSNLSALVFPDQTLYEKYAKLIYSSQQKFCAYPVTVTFQDENGGVLDARDVLYNRPLNYAVGEDMVWGEDTGFTFPETDGAPEGYQIKWAASPSNLSGVASSVIVQWDTLYPVQSLMDPVITGSGGIDKVYDGTPSELTAYASHPLASSYDDAGPGDVIFYYWWYWDTMGPREYVLTGFDESVYDVGGVRAPFAIGCNVIVQAYVVTPEYKAKLFFTAPTYSFVVDLRKGEPAVNPVYPAETILLSEGLPRLTLSQGDTAGTIAWDEGQTLAEGENLYDWTFLPEDADNYKEAKGQIALKAAATLSPPDPNPGDGGSSGGGSKPSGGGGHSGGSGSGGSGAASGTNGTTGTETAKPNDGQEATSGSTTTETISGDGYDVKKSVTKEGDQVKNTQVAAEIRTGGAGVTAEKVKDALQTAAKEAETLYKETGVPAQTKLEIASDTKSTAVPSAALSAVKDAGAVLTLRADTVRVTFGDEAVATLAEAGGETLIFEAAVVPEAGSEAQTAGNPAVGAPEGEKSAVFSLSLRTERGAISDLKGDVAVEVPYQISDPARTVIVYYLSEDGSRTRMTRVAYDAADKQVTFRTTHFSLYEVKDIASVPFEDVKGHWAEEAVSQAVERGLFKGTSATAFSPEEIMTRAMLITVLYHEAGSPEAGKQPNFTDVKEGAWYAGPVDWAAANGIVKGLPDGTSEGAFSLAPDRGITREELAVMLYAASGDRLNDGVRQDPSAAARGGTQNSPASSAKFSDWSSVSDWARTAVSWAIEKRLLSGKGGGVLDPAGFATRAEVAAMFQNYD